jgi:hypothetical protein
MNCFGKGKASQARESLMKSLGVSVHPCVPRGSRFSMVLNQSSPREKL